MVFIRFMSFDEVKQKVIAEIDEYNMMNKNGINYVSITTQFKYLQLHYVNRCDIILWYHLVLVKQEDIVIPQHICKPPNEIISLRKVIDVIFISLL